MSDNPKMSVDEISEIEQNRIDKLNEAGISEKDVLKQANDHLNSWQSSFNENMTRGRSDLDFCLKDQWTSLERAEFSRLFKVCFTFNKMLDHVNKAIGEQRKNKPDLLVRSLTGKSTQDAVNLRADIIRTIAYSSETDLVYQTAFKSALLMGWGAFMVDYDYKNPNSFEKIIKYRLISDPTKCSWDPSATKPHKGDGDYCSYQYVMTRDQFDATYPYIYNPVSYSDPTMFTDFQWETKDTIILCDYYVKEWFPVKVLLLSNGETVTQEKWEKMQGDIKKQKELAAQSLVVGDVILDMIPEVRAERQTQDYKIMHYRLIKNQIIDFSEWPSRQLPIIFVDGNSHFIEGRQCTRSFVHEARDAQKFVNYVGSEIATEIKNRRREQWLGTPENIVGQEQQWRNPETQTAILIANPDPSTGQMPIKQPAWQLSNELLMQFQRGSQDIREILGFSESQQINGRDISGVARRERKMEGSMAIYVYQDNLNQAIEQGGRVSLDLLPYIVGEDERNMVLSKKDGTSKNITLNKKMSDGSVENEIDSGEYDIELDTGPSFAVQKETALEFFQQTLAANPQLFPLIADLWAKNLDVQYMQQIVDRFKTLVPPEVLAKEEGKEPPPPKPNPQEEMMKMEMQAKQAELQAKEKELEIKMEELELKKAKLMLDAQKIQMESELNVYDHQANIEKSRVAHGLDNRKAEMDYTAKIAKITADLHTSSQKHQSERKE